MENFQIEDSQISASSQYWELLSAAAGRLNFFVSNENAGAWCPLVPDDNQWFQVDFLRTVKVTGFATQGRHSTRGKQWPLEYTLSFREGSDNDVKFQFYRKQGRIEVCCKQFYQFFLSVSASFV